MEGLHYKHSLQKISSKIVSRKELLLLKKSRGPFGDPRRTRAGKDRLRQEKVSSKKYLISNEGLSLSKSQGPSGDPGRTRASKD